jgi:hypothetical protein
MGMWGRYWLHLSDLTNRKETPPFSPAGPHIRSGLLDPTSFQKLRFGTFCAQTMILVEPES